jgi:FtsZ-interacting cell division protein ZipA
MDNQVMMAIVIAVAVVAVLAVAWMVVRRRQTMALREKFGPEYDHVLRAKGTPSEAERELLERQRRVSSFALRPLPAEEAERFSASWRTVQAHFVDDPRSAVVDADRLIGEVMRARGYPVEDPDRRLDDLSVEHAQVVNHYRDANAIMARHERGEESTEELRQAKVHFRALFDELVAAQHRITRRAS